jgi:glucosamine-6-phosphate deaminase
LTPNGIVPAGAPLRITTFGDERALAKALAGHIAAHLRENPRLVLGLPTGRTPIRLYRELVALHARGNADFSLATTFNLDEFAGLDPSNPGSYRTFMAQHLFAHVNLAPERIHFLNGAAADLEAECVRYEDEIAAVGGIDLLILGIGTNGHIGFNEPARALIARTHKVELKAETRRSNASLFGGDAERVPREALSMGMATILHTRRILLIATGKSKATAIRGLVAGPITPKLPASFLELHGNVDLWLDGPAASRLPDGQPTTSFSAAP